MLRGSSPSELIEHRRVVVALFVATSMAAATAATPSSGDSLPTQIFSAAYSDRLGANAPRWNARDGARVNDNAEVASRMLRYMTTTTPSPSEREVGERHARRCQPFAAVNIGLIHVRLSNWTDKPTRGATRSPLSLPSDDSKRRSLTAASNGRVRERPSRRRHPNEPTELNQTTSLSVRNEKTRSDAESRLQAASPTVAAERRRYAPVDNTFIISLSAAFIGLVLLLTSLCLVVSCQRHCRSARRERERKPLAACRRRRRRRPMPPGAFAYQGNPWGSTDRGGDLEHLFRHDRKRPPLIAPPPPPPRIAPPPIPQLRSHPCSCAQPCSFLWNTIIIADTRRKYFAPPHRNSPVQREIRQQLKRQISESTISSRTRTNSF